MTGPLAGAGRLDLALVHYPVLDRQGQRIGAAVTNLDIHDLARAARTYGAGRVYLVTPYREQQQLVRAIVDHWLRGAGRRNRARREALGRVRLAGDVAGLCQNIAVRRGEKPVVLVTSAKPVALPTLSYETVRRRLEGGESFLLLFGTAWGLAPEVVGRADGALPPLRGKGAYNHLSVRSAAAITLDRLLAWP